MDFNELFKHSWRVWLNHGFGQTVVQAPDLETAQKEALAWCRKQQAMLDPRNIETMINRAEMIA